MLDSIRDTLHSVQENLSASFRGFATSDTPNKSTVSKQPPVNLLAGTEVLEHFQTSWSELHNLSQENATKAQEVDQLIGKLHKKLQKQWTDLGQTGSTLSKIPQVVYAVNSLSEKLDDMEQLFTAVEQALIQLEDIVETRELQDRQLDHRFQLALYKEKKLSHLEGVRVNLAKEHTEKVKLHELRQQRVLRERQDAFEHQFKQDVQLYKETNKLPKLDVNKEGMRRENSLEEVILDNEDTAELNNFLLDTAAEDLPSQAEELPTDLS